MQPWNRCAQSSAVLYIVTLRAKLSYHDNSKLRASILTKLGL